MRFLRLFKLPQTEQFVFTWKAVAGGSIFLSYGYSTVRDSNTLRDAFPLYWAFAAT
jgi:hypothetical protein